MSNPRTELFNRLLREVTKPGLDLLDFDYDSSRTFRRTVPDSKPAITQIINFQFGQRSLEGRFTVNLAVHHPDFASRTAPAGRGKPGEEDCAVALRMRLGLVRQRRSIVTRLRERISGPRDHWWPLSSNEKRMRRILSIVTLEILGPGLGWVETHSNNAKCAEVVSS